MIGIDDEIELAGREGLHTLRKLAAQQRLTLRQIELADALIVSQTARTRYWVDVRDAGSGSEGFVISERVYRELRALGVPEAAAS